MYRLILSIVVMFLMAGCGSGNEQSGGQAKTPPTTEEPAPGTGEPRIPQPIDAVATIVFGVFGDEAASLGELAVKPGDTFDVWAIATVEGNVRPAAAQYRVVVPDGITVFAEHKILDRSMTLGAAEENFNIAFRCQEPGLVPLMRYTLKSDPGFAGGEITLLEGVPPQGPAFRGIVTCPDDGTPLKLPAEVTPLVLTVQ